ncbi:MAG: PilZ domain-containing protein [Acidobacteriota bacterium]
MAERRAVARITPSEPVQARLKTSLPARILDISSRGAQLEVTNCLKPNVVCEIRLLLEDGEVTIKATVRRCRAWGFGVDEREQRVLLYRAGVEFSQIGADIVARLRRQFALPESGEFPRVEPDRPATKASSPAPEKPPATPVKAIPADGRKQRAEDEPSRAKPTASQPPARSTSRAASASARSGPVKIRISADHVRKILDEDGES